MRELILQLARQGTTEDARLDAMIERNRQQLSALVDFPHPFQTNLTPPERPAAPGGLGLKRVR